MNDIKKIQQRLWNSLDMAWVRQQLIIMAVISAIFGLMFSIRFSDELWAVWLILGLVVGPFLVFLACRTWAIFEKPQDYFFSKAKLDHPFGGWMRDTIGFSVTVTDAEGIHHRVDTRCIFYTRSVFGMSLEDYVNREVTVAYNPATGSLVVIG